MVSLKCKATIGQVGNIDHEMSQSVRQEEEMDGNKTHCSRCCNEPG